jgi:hypothetical protein
MSSILPDDQIALIQEMMVLRKEIVKSFEEINVDMTALVSRGGPFTCHSVRTNTTILLELFRKDLQFPEIAELLLFQSYPEDEDPIVDLNDCSHSN